MRQTTLASLLLLALLSGCTSRYADGWQAEPAAPAAIEDPRPAPRPSDTVKPAQPAPARKPPAPDDGLSAANAKFRSAYKVARETMLARAGYALVLGDSVVFFRGASRKEVNTTPALYHELKSVAHVPLALFVMLHQGGPLSEATLADLRELQQATQKAREDLREKGYEAKLLKRQEAILAASAQLMERALAARNISAEDVSLFATTLAPLVLENAYDAARAQLDGINEAFRGWVRELSTDEQRSFLIVVSGSHQARDKNLQMTYCRALLGETGPVEVRLIFGEGCFDETSCRNLLGTVLLDRAASRAFFDDPFRLQYDLLGDAAAQIVPGLKLPK